MELICLKEQVQILKDVLGLIDEFKGQEYTDLEIWKEMKEELKREIILKNTFRLYQNLHYNTQVYHQQLLVLTPLIFSSCTNTPPPEVKDF